MTISRRRSVLPAAVLVAVLGLWAVWSQGGRADVGQGVRRAVVLESSETERGGATLVDVDARATDEGRVAERTEPSAPSQSPAPRADEIQGSTMLRGRVVEPGGGALRPGETRAIVALISLHEGAPGSRGDRAVAEADDDGTFELEVTAWARGGPVLLTARRRGRQPWSEIVTLDDAFLSERREHVLELGEGVALQGRVVRDGAPVHGAHVSIDVAYGIGGVFDAGPEAWWAEGRLEEKHGHAQSDADGWFEIPGMGAYEHRVEVTTSATDAPGVRGRLYAIAAPDSRIYDLSSAQLAVTVHGGDSVMPGAEVHVSCEGHGVVVESAEEPVVVEVPPESAVAIEVRHPLARHARVEVEAPIAGGVLAVHVPLEVVARPSLAVLLPGAHEAGIDGLRLRLQQVAGFDSFELDAVRASARDTYRVAVVPRDPERLNVVLEPHGGGAGRFISPRTREIDLPADGEVWVEFDLELWGRVDVDLRSPLESDWGAHQKFVDDEGRSRLERDVHLWQMGDDIVAMQDISIFTAHHFHSKFRSTESAEEVARRCGVLPAGRYTLEITSEKHLPWSAPVTVEAGRVTRVEAPLEPK
ncbi:MAG: hypothetical protein AAGI22_06730 [Planctomycetota bacterium]